MDEWVEDELELTLLVVADILVVFEDVNDETVLLDSIELNVVGASVEVVEDAVDERTLLVGTKLDVVGTSVDRITDTKDEDTLLDEIELNVVGISDEMVTDARVTDGMTLVITPGTVELGTTTGTDVETIAVVETAVEVTEDNWWCYNDCASIIRRCDRVLIQVHRSSQGEDLGIYLCSRRKWYPWR